LSELSSVTLASVIARTMDEKLAKDIVILNISNVSILADYFVICSADTSTQVRALSQNIEGKIKELFERKPSGEESDLKNRWNLLDYGDVVVHILHKEERQLYALEKFWSHGCILDRDSWMKESEEFFKS